METSFNLCDMTGIADNNVLKLVSPGIVEQFKKTVLPCPYEEEFRIGRFEVDGGAFPDVLGQKATKTEVKFTRGSLVPIMTVVFYGNTKGTL
jgi:hypothetical protein